MSSRLDGSLATVVTGQAVETFDKLFCNLYANSSSVDLRQVAMESEPEAQPEKDPLPLPAMLAPSSAIAMKLYSPKYALALCSTSTISSTPPAAGQDGGEEISKDPEDPKKKRCRGAGKEEPSPLHPGLSSLEKVCLISFLPTWPEPDPPSDVIGVINIRDISKPVQAHLQRSEMFETSKVIRFSSPISIPEEVLPEVAKPRQLTATPEKVRKLSQGQIAAGEGPHAWPGDLKRKPEHNTPSCEMQPKSVRKRYEEDISSTTEASSGEGLRPAPPGQSAIPPGSNANAVTRLQTPNSSSPTCVQLSSSSSPPNPALRPSGSPPVPKPRTVQLVIKDAVHHDGQKHQEVSIVRGQQTGAGSRVQDKPAAAMDLQNCAEPVRGGKIGEAQDKVLGNTPETVIQEVVRDVKEKPKSKQASESGDLSAAATERGSAERGVTGFGCQEVTCANRKSMESPKTTFISRQPLQEMPQTAPTQGFPPALDKTNVPAGASARAHGAALNPPRISELSPTSHASTCSLPVPPRKGFPLGAPDTDLLPPSPPGRTLSTPSPDPRVHAPDGRACTDVRTPTPDISDEYASSRTLSTTSEEFYECSDVPFNEASECTDVCGGGGGEGNASVLADPASPLALSSPDHNEMKGEEERNGRESSTGDRRGETMAARDEPPSLSPLSPREDEMVKLKEKERNWTSGPKNGSLLSEVLHDESRKGPGARLDVGVTSESQPSSRGHRREEKVTARNDKRDAIKERSKRGVIKETEEQKVSIYPACYLSS